MSSAREEIKLADERAAEAERRSIAEARLREHFDALRRDIKKGRVSTGDRVKDYYIAELGVDEHPTLALAQKLEADLKDKKGQLVLVIERQRKGTTHTFGRGWSDFRLVTHYMIGLANDDKLVLGRDREAVLPVTAYVIADGRRHRKFEFGISLELSELSEHDQGEGKQVIVGDEAVFAFKPSSLFFDEKLWEITSRYCARLLGKDIPLSDIEKKAREEERVQVLKSLDNARDYYKNLRDRIREVESNPLYGGDEAFVGPYGQAKEALERLRSLLASARELGAEDDPLVQLIERELPPEKK